MPALRAGWRPPTITPADQRRRVSPIAIAAAPSRIRIPPGTRLAGNASPSQTVEAARPQAGTARYDRAPAGRSPPPRTQRRWRASRCTAAWRSATTTIPPETARRSPRRGSRRARSAAPSGTVPAVMPTDASDGGGYAGWPRPTWRRRAAGGSCPGAPCDPTSRPVDAGRIEQHDEAGESQGHPDHLPAVSFSPKNSTGAGKTHSGMV